LIVERTDFISVPVTDLERSTRFYEETLGLPKISAGGWPEFQLGENFEFQGETLDTEVCHMAFFHDPDGNSLMLHRRYAPLQ